jgi:peroxiredoxin
MTSIAVATLPKAGDLAPDFTLTSTSGKKETLSSYRGQKHVLLCFFPFAFSSTCTAQFCEMRDAWEQYTAHDLVVFPISVDSKYALAEYKAKYGMQPDLLSDFLRDVSAAYGVLHPERQFSNRSYFLIDKSGVVRWAHVEQHGGFKRDNAELLAEIARLA